MSTCSRRAGDLFKVNFFLTFWVRAPQFPANYFGVTNTQIRLIFYFSSTTKQIGCRWMERALFNARWTARWKMKAQGLAPISCRQRPPLIWVSGLRLLANKPTLLTLNHLFKDAAWGPALEKRPTIRTPTKDFRLFSRLKPVEALQPKPTNWINFHLWTISIFPSIKNRIKTPTSKTTP